MRLIERLNIPKENFDYLSSIEWLKKLRKDVPQEVAMKNLGVGWYWEFELSQHFFIALEAYVAEAFSVTREYAQKGIENTHEYYFGQWRDTVPSGNYRDRPPDRAYQDKIMPWSTSWQDCLLWCSVLGRWDDLLKFAEYPKDDIKLDIDQSPENRAWLLLVAGKLRGRPIEELQPFADTVVNGKRKRERLLLALFEAILEEDPHYATSCLKDYATYYKVSEFPKDEINKKVAFDASFLVHYAEFTDVQISVPDKMKDHIVRLP